MKSSGDRVRAFISIGSNIEPHEHIPEALDLLTQQLGALEVSPAYRNPAQDFVGDDFINLVISFIHKQGFDELVQALDLVERACGRQRETEIGKGSRTLDLDILIYGHLTGEHFGKHLPRADIFERQFVWQPLLDLLKNLSDRSNLETSIYQEVKTKANGVPLMQPSFIDCSGNDLLTNCPERTKVFY